jgi:hypothetical protein
VDRLSGLNTEARERHNALTGLQFHWGEAYEITYDVQSGKWRARRRDTGDLLEADGSGELRGKLADDYAARPVPREPEP